MIKKILLIILLFTLTGCANTADLGASSDVSATALASKYNLATEIKSKYQLDGTALKMVAKNDPKDMVRVTVGNEPTGLGAETEFEPAVKISRWDEVSLKIKPKDLDKVAKKDKKVKLEDGKIKFETPKQDFELYDLPASEDLPEGGYEFEWILKEKPTTNVVEFSIETEGLDFFYQPPLNIEMASSACSETDCGDSHRPENVVGSYAIYTSEQKINWTGGKEYKVGKLGHIYRPKILDSAGHWVWGELNIDIENKKLTVTIPQDFLDKAVYPIRHAAGLTIGITTIGGSTVNGLEPYYLVNKRQQATATGAMSKIQAAVWDTGANSYIKVWLYNDSSGSPGSLLANSYPGALFISRTTKPTQDSEWTSSTSVSGSIVNGNYYWSAYHLGDSTVNVAFDSGSNGDSKYRESAYANSPVDPAGAMESYTDRFSIYATYTASGGTTTPSPPQQIIIFD